MVSQLEPSPASPRVTRGKPLPRTGIDCQTKLIHDPTPTTHVNSQPSIRLDSKPPTGFTTCPIRSGTCSGYVHVKVFSNSYSEQDSKLVWYPRGCKWVTGKQFVTLGGRGSTHKVWTHVCLVSLPDLERKPMTLHRAIGLLKGVDED